MYSPKNSGLSGSKYFVAAGAFSYEYSFLCEQCQRHQGGEQHLQPIGAHARAVRQCPGRGRTIAQKTEQVEIERRHEGLRRHEPVCDLRDVSNVRQRLHDSFQTATEETRCWRRSQALSLT